MLTNAMLVWGVMAHVDAPVMKTTQNTLKRLANPLPMARMKHVVAQPKSVKESCENMRYDIINKHKLD